jgi:hypothetical protein
LHLRSRLPTAAASYNPPVRVLHITGSVLLFTLLLSSAPCAAPILAPAWTRQVSGPQHVYPGLHGELYAFWADMRSPWQVTCINPDGTDRWTSGSTDIPPYLDELEPTPRGPLLRAGEDALLLDAATGAVVWRFDGLAWVRGHMAPPGIEADYVVATLGRLSGLSTTGEELWAYAQPAWEPVRDGESFATDPLHAVQWIDWANPNMGGYRHLVGRDGRSLGIPREHPACEDFVSARELPDGNIAVLTYEAVYGLGRDGEILWEGPVLGREEFIAGGQRLEVLEGELRARLLDGSPLWSVHSPVEGLSSVELAGDGLVLLGFTGLLDPADPHSRGAEDRYTLIRIGTGGEDMQTALLDGSAGPRDMAFSGSCIYGLEETPVEGSETIVDWTITCWRAPQ